MNRCLNVLKEAANNMIYGKDHDIVDIEYYKQNEVNSSESENEDISIIILNKARRKLRKPQK